MSVAVGETDGKMIGETDGKSLMQPMGNRQ
jgi:hypothetical protein